MFGMSFAEIVIVILVAVLVLGPEKLPNAIVEVAKFFKFLKKNINEAKTAFDQEMKIAELKADAEKYKNDFAKTTQTMRKKLTFEELEDAKNQIKDISSDINKIKSDISDSLDPTKIIKDSKPDQNLAQNDSSEEKGENLDKNLKENRDV